MINWYLQNGKDSDVVISSRIRLARNLADFPFKEKAKTKDLEQVLKTIKEITPSIGYNIKYIELKNIDEISRKFSKEEFSYSICPIRFSIGAILLPRETWNKMEKFDVCRGNNMGLDEVKLCQFCTIYSRVMVISENILVGHFSYGPQTSEMKKYYQEHKEIFSLKS